MSRRARQRPDKRVATNAIELAMRRVAFITQADLAMQRTILTAALDEFRLGTNCPVHWRSLADASNVAETLCAMGHGAGPDVERVISDAQRVLHDVMQRHRTRGTWTLWPDEMDALGWLVDVHIQQMTHCTYGAFCDAMQATERRVAQALAGNAPRGAIVITGDMGDTAHAHH